MGRTVNRHMGYRMDVGPASPEQIKQRRKDHIDGVLGSGMALGIAIATAPVTGGMSLLSLPIIGVYAFGETLGAIWPNDRRTKPVSYR